MSDKSLLIQLGRTNKALIEASASLGLKNAALDAVREILEECPVPGELRWRPEIGDHQNGVEGGKTLLAARIRAVFKAHGIYPEKE